MRILFTGLPAAGHVLPMLPLAAAARAAGHETVLTTSVELGAKVSPMEVLPVMPPTHEMMAETARRSAGGDARHPGLAAAEHFAGTVVDLTFDAVLEAARRYRPQLLVCAQLDFVGPLIAATIDVPWVWHGITGPLPRPLWEAMVERSGAQFAARSLQRRPRKAYVDIFPDLLRFPGETAAHDVLPMRPGRHEGDGSSHWTPGPDSGRPRVLLTLGTSVDEPEAVQAIAVAAAAAGADVLVTVDQVELGDDVQPGSVRAVGFVPLADVLPTVDAVVSAGGTGTLLASLSAGVPLVIRPFLADQPWNAERAAQTGAAVVVEDFGEVTAAVRQVLDEPAYRRAARRAAETIDAMPAPDVVVGQILAAL